MIVLIGVFTGISIPCGEFDGLAVYRRGPAADALNPLNQGRFAGFHVHGFHLRVGNVALVFQFAQEILSGFQVQNADVAHVVRGILSNRVVAAVVQQEGHAVERLPGGGVRLVEQNPGLRHIRDGQRRGFTVRHGEIFRRRVDFIAFRRLDFHQIIIPGIKAGVDSPVAARRDFLHQSAVNRPGFKGRVGQALRLVGAVELDDFDAACLILSRGKTAICKETGFI